MAVRQPRGGLSIHECDLWEVAAGPAGAPPRQPGSICVEAQATESAILLTSPGFGGMGDTPVLRPTRLC